MKFVVLAESGHKLPIDAPSAEIAILTAIRRWDNAGVDCGVVRARPIDPRNPKLDVERPAKSEPVPAKPALVDVAALLARPEPALAPERRRCAPMRLRAGSVPAMAIDRGAEVVINCGPLPLKPPGGRP